MTRLRRIGRAAFCGLVSAAAASGGACSTPGQDLRIQVERAPAVSAEIQMGAEVGRLLSPDPDTSSAAEKRLVALTGDDLERFLAYARGLGEERDVRLLNVLDEHHALPALTTEEKLEFLLWKTQRRERFYVMKAQSRLADLARADPAPLVARLQRGGKEVDVLGVVLGITRTLDAVPPLIERYRKTSDARSRAAAAEALGMIAGEELRPRSSGRDQDIERDADTLAAWYGTQLEMQDAARAPEAAPPERLPEEKR